MIILPPPQPEATDPHPIAAILLAHNLAVSTAIADVITFPGPAPAPSDPDDIDPAVSPASLQETLASILSYIKKNDRAVTELGQTTFSHVTCLDLQMTALGDRVDYMTASLTKTTE